MEPGRAETEKAPVSDEQIIELYWLRNERAIRETDLKYRKYLLSVAYNIVHDRQDCEECLDDTYLGAWNSMPPSRPAMLKAFLTTIMRRVAVNRYQSHVRKKRVPSEMTISLSELEDLIEDSNAEEAFDARHLGDVLSDFIHGLSKRRRFIFMSRYYMADTVDRIAHELGLSRSTVNKELAAIRMLLKERLEREGYAV